MTRRKPAAAAIADGSKIKRKTKTIEAQQPPRQRVTRAMKGRSICMAVFNTAELLERILLLFEPRNIFGIQRVCTQFRDIVASSPKLRERCWLRLPVRPAGTEIERWVTREHRVGWARATGAETAQKTYVPVQLGPFMQPGASANWTASCAQLGWLYQDGNAAYPNVRATIHGHDSQISLLKTQLCDPPCDTWVVNSMRVTLRSDPWIYAELSNPVRVRSGPTLGGILQRILKASVWTGAGPWFARMLKENPPRQPPSMATLEDIQDEFDLGGKFEVEILHLQLHPVGTVITTEAERLAVA